MILLMVASLEDGRLNDLLGLADELGLTTLVEVHKLDELHRASELGADLIGVNARNLKIVEVDRTVFKALAPDILARVVRVAESGVAVPEDVAEYYS